MSLTDPFTTRLTRDLEPVLSLADPRTKISSYHDMPYAIFRYEPEEEFDLRKQVTLLETRLAQKGKRIKRISLAECMSAAMQSRRPIDEWFSAERDHGVDTMIDTVHAALSEEAQLLQIVEAQFSQDSDPLRDIVFFVRAGALFPVYRCHTLLEQLHGKLRVPAVLFYPGTLDGAVALKFMGVFDADPNYRPKIF